MDNNELMKGLIENGVIIPGDSPLNSQQQEAIESSSSLVLDNNQISMSNSPSPQLTGEIPGEEIPINQGIDGELSQIDRNAQFLAAGRYIATQELADFYAESGAFTIPEIVQQVRDRRAKTNESQRREADPKKLAQSLIARARNAAG